VVAVAGVDAPVAAALTLGDAVARACPALILRELRTPSSS